MKKRKNKSSCLSKLGYGESCPCDLSPLTPEPHSREDQDTTLGLIASSDYSDLTIICKNRGFTAHKLVICPRCPMMPSSRPHSRQKTFTGRLEFNPKGRLQVTTEKTVGTTEL